jgi:hypothetical protein
LFQTPDLVEDRAMRAVRMALLLLVAACGGNVVVDAAAPLDAGSGGTGGTASGTGAGGSTEDAGQLVVCAGVTCMAGEICCAPAGPELVCFQGTGCPP